MEPSTLDPYLRPTKGEEEEGEGEEGEKEGNEERYDKYFFHLYYGKEN
jgi:hypothetical protein